MTRTPKMEFEVEVPVQINVHLDSRKVTSARVVLSSTGSTQIAPASHIDVTASGAVFFTVTYIMAVGSTVEATLTAKLFIDGGASPDFTDTAQVIVRRPGGGSGEDAQVGTPAARAKTGVGVAAGPGGAVWTYSDGIRVKGEHAASVICVVYRIDSTGQMVIDFVNRAMFLPRDLFVVVLTPAARELNRCYFLYWVNDLGEILKVTGGPVV